MNHNSLFPQITRRRMLKSTAALAASSMWAAQGGALRALAATHSPTPGNQPIPSGSLAQVPLTVTTTQLGNIFTDYVGLAYSKESILGTLFTGTDSSMIEVFKRLGSSSLRIGGSTVDNLVWHPTGTRGTHGQVCPADVDNLAAFLTATNWNCIYGINLAGASKGDTNPTLAAEEVAYVVEKLGSRLVGIEIGNEPDLYGRPGNPYANNWTYDDFMALWTKFYNAIVAKTPHAPIAGAAACTPLTWTVPFAGDTRGKTSIATHHYYVACATAANATTTELLDVSLHRDVTRNFSAINAACVEAGIPYRIGETNSFYNNTGVNPPEDIAASYTTALWCLDYMFMCAQCNCAGVNFESGGDIPGYPPILNMSDYVCAIYPLFYGMLFFTLAGTGRVLETTVAPGSLNVTGYAIGGWQKGYSVIVLNKESTQNIQVQIELPKGVTKATLMELTQRSPGKTVPSLLATSGVTIQGAEVQTDGAFSPDAPYELTPDGNKLTCYVPAMSAVLIKAA
jgi:hypothetical protein